MAFWLNPLSQVLCWIWECETGKSCLGPVVSWVQFVWGWWEWGRFCYYRADSISPVVPAQSVYSLAEAWKGWVSISTSKRSPSGFDVSSQGLLAAWEAAKHMVMIWAGRTGASGLWGVAAGEGLCSLSHFLSGCCTDVQKYSHPPYTLGLLWSWPGRKQILEEAQHVNWGVKGEIRHLFWLSVLSSIMAFFTESSNTIIIPPWSQ